MNDPMRFMQTHPLDIPLNSAELGGDLARPALCPRLWQPGVYEFDIAGSTSGFYYLSPFETRSKETNWRSRRISAYWLPWNSDGFSSIQLGDQADYFFTSALGGCRIQIGAGNAPEVRHISGSINRSGRKAIARTMPNYAQTRRFSQTKEYPASELAFFIGKAEGLLWHRRWHFYAQGINIDENSNRAQVVALRAQQVGVVEV